MLKHYVQLLFVVTVMALLAPGLCLGQEFRATITGVVTDSSKAVIPNATVTVVNLDTGRTTTVQTNADGTYTVPYLQPGQKLQVSARATGFTKSTYPPIVLHVSQTQTANFVLQVGAANQEVTVSSDSYQVGLDSAKADRGIVVDNKTITELPLDGRNPLSLLDTVAGVTNENSPGSQGVANDAYNASWYTINGGKAQNTEYTIDGMPNNSIPWYSSGPSAIPSVDAIQEFKVITNPYDAQFGRTAGGVVSMELKSGTNTLHGSVYEFAKRGFLDANSWGNNYQGLPRGNHTEDQYGFEVGGPVFIPHLYDGRDKTFFMFNMERFRQKLPSYSTFDLPNPQWLKGDFTNFVDSSGALIPVYDPATATTSDPTRQIFKNSAGEYNKVDPSRLNPVALKALNLMMSGVKPTTQAIPGALPWESIWVNTIPNTSRMDNYILKLDQAIGTKDHISANYIHDTNLNQTFSTPANVVWGNGEHFTEYKMNTGVDWVHTFRSNLFSDVHVSYQRYWRTDGQPQSWNYDPTQLGFSSALIGQLPLQRGFPQIRFNMQQQSAGTGDGYNNWMGMSRDRYYFPDDTYSFAPTVSWNKGKHTLRAGLDFRITHAAQNVSWTNVLQISSNGIATSEYWNANNSNDQAALPDGTPLSQSAGNAILDFLIGQPNSVSVTNARDPYYTWHYYAPWVQDDWKVTQKLTLNLGFRYDVNGPPTARHNWINTGFDFTTVSPVDALVNRSVAPNLPQITGGITFPKTSGTNTPWSRDYSKYQPRIGFAYLARPETVIRGGIGRLVMSPMGDEPQTTGYANDPSYVSSPDGGRTYFGDNLTNPFPQGIPAVPGDSLGLMTNVGNSVSFRNPNYKLPYVWQASFGVQQAIGHNGKLDISYVGSRSYAQDVTYNAVDTAFDLYKSCNATLGTASNPNPQAQCQGLTKNPFYGVAGVQGSLGRNKTTSKYQLARPHPQFAGITESQNNWGKSWYNSLQTTYNQRVSWVQVSGSWTWSKTMRSGGYVDNVYLIPIHSIADTDRAHRITMTSVLNLPIGRGMKYFSGMNRPVDAVLGGWELGSSFFWETGQSLGLSGSYNLIGSIHGSKRSQPDVIDLGMNQCVERWKSATNTTPGSYQVFTGNGQTAASCSGNIAWQQLAPYAPHNTQTLTDQVRAPGTNQLDVNLAKTFKFTERVHMQLRMEEQNVLNHPTWYYGVSTNPTDSNFGTVNKPLVGQSNSPRFGQLAVKILW